MPRIRRFVRPTALIHIIVRFVNHEFLLDSSEERDEYLRRARIAFRRTDWIALSYALMSSHTHFAAIAGQVPFADWSRPLHSGFVLWLNQRRGRLGAAIANRPSTYEVAPTACARLIAYHHNNPVRAGVVDCAAKSDWTSDRAYRLGDSSDWLRDDIGLELAGFDGSPTGRRAFSSFVDASANDEWTLQETELLSVRRAARSQLGSAVEIGHPIVGGSVQVPLYSPSSAALRETWSGSLARIAKAVCTTLRITQSELTSRHRPRHIVMARRMFLLIAMLAGRSLTETSAYLGISVQAASKAVAKADAELRRQALVIGESLGISTHLG